MINVYMFMCVGIYLYEIFGYIYIFINDRVICFSEMYVFNFVVEGVGVVKVYLVVSFVFGIE